MIRGGVHHPQGCAKQYRQALRANSYSATPRLPAPRMHAFVNISSCTPCLVISPYIVYITLSFSTRQGTLPLLRGSDRPTLACQPRFSTEKVCFRVSDFASDMLPCPESLWVHVCFRSSTVAVARCSILAFRRLDIQFQPSRLFRIC